MTKKNLRRAPRQLLREARCPACTAYVLQAEALTVHTERCRQCQRDPVRCVLAINMATEELRLQTRAGKECRC
jgi:hypothetical protein